MTPCSQGVLLREARDKCSKPSGQSSRKEKLGLEALDLQKQLGCKVGTRENLAMSGNKMENWFSLKCRAAVHPAQTEG